MDVAIAGDRLPATGVPLHAVLSWWVSPRSRFCVRGRRTEQPLPRKILESEQIHPEVAARIEEAGIPDVDVESLGENPDYLERLVRQTEIKEIVLQTMVEQDLDALLYSPSTVPPVSIEENQPFSEMNCELSAHSGLPAIVVPAEFTDDGLPIGVELLRREFAESTLLELAYAYEQTIQHRCSPNRFGPL